MSWKTVLKHCYETCNNGRINAWFTFQILWHFSFLWLSKIDLSILVVPIFDMLFIQLHIHNPQQHGHEHIVFSSLISDIVSSECCIDSLSNCTQKIEFTLRDHVVILERKNKSLVFPKYPKGRVNLLHFSLALSTADQPNLISWQHL